ncbi:MAG: lysine--tRNA ligase [Bacteroidales bacterium]|nr:lysine--tRNA ligase [Bacteroidales bacterium]
MSWLDDLERKLHDVDIQVVNDAKSPSGRPHVGALRGVLIHDAVYKFLKDKGIKVKNIYGSDDYDPMDELPGGQTAEKYDKYLGAPLSNVPAPEGSEHKDIAMHYISDFFNIFDEIGAEAEFYYMRDYYKSGFFNEAIDILLSRAAEVREIYKKVSNADRPNDWFPAQVVCEKCGKLGTTQIIDYDGKEATYVCREDMVTWAKGCGYKGKVSPFDGNGKLPYKVEWASKWKYLGITIEGAGTDHNTRGGSRDVADAVSRRIFNYQPPVNIPYGFFLMGGAKMSSSKGIGATARDMTNFLPPEILRYLMLTTQPKRAINFEPSQLFITKLFNDYDKLHNKIITGDELPDYEQQIYTLSNVFTDKKYEVVDFSLIVTLIQLPHIDIFERVEERFGRKLTEAEHKNLQKRIEAAKYWLENLATEEELIQLQETLPEEANELSQTQRGFLRTYAKHIKTIDWTEEGLQTAVFDAARLTPINPKLGFAAIYRTVLNKQQGPKAGSLIAYIDKDFIETRFNELDFDIVEYWNETSISQDDFDAWMRDNKDKIIEQKEQEITENSTSVKEYVVSLNDGKTYLKRVKK